MDRGKWPDLARTALLFFEGCPGMFYERLIRRTGTSLKPHLGFFSKSVVSMTMFVYHMLINIHTVFYPFYLQT